ncbi:unnamed protein product [Ranitomeya imitator]|uniref:GIY-YIG domain-containing protein n=1 Tax=Ranitomeya imitator TaxID=111125 RepID=A0ABN9MNT2_9NEOB|nr:unnamed protein product [Ranitomeya imitator]CAJ0968012.1 unnamed protein product [Ranitomeya imitator]
MGANVAPAYANIYMDNYENAYVYNNTLFRTYSRCWLRFIDDIFCLWTGPHDTLLRFTEYLNSIRPELQFTLNSSPMQISFLDTLVIREPNGSLVTDIFSKLTDSNSLLHYQSCHPISTKQSLPRSQFKRVARIVSKPSLLPERLEEMSQKFMARDYPVSLLNKEKMLATNPSFSPNSQPKPERVPFVHSHHPVMPVVYDAIRKHWPLLKQAYPHIQAFSTPPLLCKRRPNNIRDKVVKADIGSFTRVPRQTFLSTERNGTFPCLRCACCSNVIKSATITHPHSGKQFRINGFFTCDSNNVIYVVKCPCGLLYVGETTQHIRDRIASHKSTIRCKKTWLPLPYHFVSANHSISQLRFQVLEQVDRPRRGGNHIKQLREREAHWIYTLQTLTPKGLNRELDLVC